MKITPIWTNKREPMIPEDGINSEGNKTRSFSELYNPIRPAVPPPLNQVGGGCTPFTPIVTIHPWSLESIGAQLAFNQASTMYSGAASAAWPTANKAMFIPFYIMKSATFNTLFVANGLAAAGNVDVGIYDEAGNKIISSGSVAQAPANDLQLISIASLLLTPGRYWLALALSDVGGTIMRGTFEANAAQAWAKAAGMAEQASAFPLPATATFATFVNNYVPLFGISMRSTI